MSVRAVVFDIGGVLERTQPPGAWLGQWPQRLGLTQEEFDRRFETVDPDRSMSVGAMTELQYERRAREALVMPAEQSALFMATMWDWYCGELDDDLMAFATSIGQRWRGTRTAILSNSADGARREEQRRYGFAESFDPILYSHEIGLAKPDPRAYAATCEALALAPGDVVFLDNAPANVEAATAFGLRALLHVDTAASIAAIEALLGRG